MYGKIQKITEVISLICISAILGLVSCAFSSWVSLGRNIEGRERKVSEGQRPPPKQWPSKSPKEESWRARVSVGPFVAQKGRSPLCFASKGDRKQPGSRA